MAEKEKGQAQSGGKTWENDIIEPEEGEGNPETSFSGEKR